mmetsp:Transcript_25364/g.52579  ORF Transcript_25364/g.52579 Transcript_25364/m.52579 type:complete len:82 (+) Transcript_25364:304-549(+)
MDMPMRALRQLRDRDLEGKLLELLLEELLLDEEAQTVLTLDISLAPAGLHSLGAPEIFSVSGPGRITVITAGGRAVCATFS